MQVYHGTWLIAVQGRRAAGASDDVVAVARVVSRARDTGDAGDAGDTVAMGVPAPSHTEGSTATTKLNCYYGGIPRVDDGADIYIVECARPHVATWLLKDTHGSTHTMHIDRLSSKPRTM